MIVGFVAALEIEVLCSKGSVLVMLWCIQDSEELRMADAVEVKGSI
jgi:hypothetical protein